MGQVTLALGDCAQPVLDQIDRGDDAVRKYHPGDTEQHHQHGARHQRQPGQPVRAGQDFVNLHETDEFPAQGRRGEDVGQIINAIDVDLDQAVRCVGDVRDVIAWQLAELLEVVLGLVAVDQQGSAVFDQHKETGLAEAGFLDHVGQRLERHVRRHDPSEVTSLVLEGFDHRHVDGVVRLPVIAIQARQLEIGVFAQGKPGAPARVPVAVICGARPLHVAALGVAHVDVTEVRVVVTDTREVIEDIFLATPVGRGGGAGFAG